MSILNMTPSTIANPLLLPNIVSNILCHIPNFTDLQKLRLVCHCWNQEVCYILRRYKTIEFSNVTSMQSYNIVFQQTCKMFDAFPHSKYKLGPLHSEVVKSTKNTTQPLIIDTIIDEFLNIFGDCITYFNLPVRTGFFDATFLDRVLNKLPNINTLGLHIQYYNFNHQSLPTFSPSTIQHLNCVTSLIISVDGLEMSEDMSIRLLSSMFTHMPNLKRISFPGDIRRISKTGLFLRDIILESETSSNLTKLCEFNFKMRLLEEHSLILLCKDFPIKSLYIDLYNPDDDEQCVSSELMAGLFRKWSATLSHLEVEFPFRKEISFHFHFPVLMENLSTLYLGGLECSILELLRKLPKLRKLDLSQLDFASVLPKPNDSDVYSNVMQLKLDFCTGQTAGILSRFSRVFPSLLNLNINHATNEVARMIFQKMNHLTTLTIQGSDLSDAGMCGFSEYDVKEKDFMSFSSVQGKRYRKYAYIADLKELQYLNIDAYALTEVTVRHGLVHCLSLRYVKMDCTAGESSSTTLFRKFKLSDYENYLVEDRQGIVEMKEEPPMDDEAIAFFSVRRHI